MHKNMNEILKYISDESTPFYSHVSVYKTSDFLLPKYNKFLWTKTNSLHWTYMMCKNHVLPDQGWKIHITCKINESYNILFDVAKYLISKEVSFKFVPNITLLQSKNSKYGDRSASGKFITIYPRDENQFAELLNDLYDITKIYQLGPYILNDQQWKNSNVFFRYGGIKEIKSVINGKETLVIKNDKGEYVEDLRVPYYHQYDFVKEPNILKSNIFTDNHVFEKLNSYNITDCIHYSNAGGVYIVEDNKKLIIKEGRKGAGIDLLGRDGYERIKNEYIALKRLTKSEKVVKVKEYFEVWENNYIVQEYVEGINIQKFITKNYPFSINDKTTLKNYFEDCKKIINELILALEDIHSRGVAMGDLSLTNVLLNPELNKVTLIDFEIADSPARNIIPTIATPGYYHKKATSYLEADWYALYRISRNLLLPIGPLYDLAPDIVKIHNKSIEERFGEESIEFLNYIELKVKKNVRFLDEPNILKYRLGVIEERLDLKNINTFINKIHNGLINNLDFNSFYLIKGNIQDVDKNINKFNVGFGAFGVILAILNNKSLCNDDELKKLKMWVDNTIPIIENQINSNDYGLFNGLTGILGCLYNMGYQQKVISISKLLKEKIYINSYLTHNDISLYSGLSGVGLYYLYLNNLINDNTFDNLIHDIKDSVLMKYENNFDTYEYGLMHGKVGYSFFLWKYGITFNDENIKNKVIDIITSINSDNRLDGELYLKDDKSNTLSPYLNNGTAGMILLLLEILKDDIDYARQKGIDKNLDKYIKSIDIFSSANGGLDIGYLGFVLIAKEIGLQSDDYSMLEDKLKNLNNYFLFDNDQILFPGDFSYKCSMDLLSGAAGVLLILNEIIRKTRLTWIPLPIAAKKEINNESI